jgi:quercetin dioxygenase-like cupin family protein
MPKLIEKPTTIPVPGNKRIDEHVGRVNTGTNAVSIALMRSPAGWSEPGQRPEFDEYTVVLSGFLRVEHEGGEILVRAGQSIHCAPGEWVRYSSPEACEYIAVCLPAFHPDTVHRDSE